MTRRTVRGELGPGLAIRPASVPDCMAIAAIYNESVVARGSTFDLDSKPAEHFEDLLASYRPGEELLLLEDLAGGRPAILGFGKIERYSDRSGYRHTAETAVYLWRKLARRGYGSMLKRAIIDRCRELGYHHLVAKIVADNTASIEYNLNFGYEIVGTQREVGCIDGVWCDVTIMQLLL